MPVRKFLRNLQTRGAFIAILQVENDGWQSKKVYSAIGHWYRIFSLDICQSLYDVKPKAQSERCVRITAHLPINCLIPNYWDSAESLKGPHRTGNGRNFLKNHRASSLMTTYRMSLISAGSISLDSTFKIHK
jgi:hypothetical protein